jgi:hypothetical protein
MCTCLRLRLWLLLLLSFALAMATRVLQLCSRLLPGARNLTAERGWTVIAAICFVKALKWCCWLLKLLIASFTPSSINSPRQRTELALRSLTILPQPVLGLVGDSPLAVRFRKAVARRRERRWMSDVKCSHLGHSN